MDHFLEPADAALAAFGSDARDGLTEEAVGRNREVWGANVLTREKGESLLGRVFSAATEPMILMLVAAGLIALGVNLFRLAGGGEADFLEVAGVFAAISLSVAITVVMEGRSAAAFEALGRISENVPVRVVRAGAVREVGHDEVVAGDVVLLGVGDRVPADGRLLEACDLTVDESALTGESVPVTKDADFVAADASLPVAERANMAFAGTFVTGGFGRMVVCAVGDGTELGLIARELGTVADTSTPLQERLARLGKQITVFGVIAAAVVFVSETASFWLHGALTPENVMEALVTSIVLIVAAVPEGLPTIVAVSLSLSVIKLARENALVKKMVAAETIGCISVICSDKTGTLTENRMTVRGVREVDGAGPDGRLVACGPDAVTSRALLDNFCLNGTADVGADGSFIGNPTEGALLACARANGRDYAAERADASLLQVWPFSSDEKHMTSLFAMAGGGSRAFVKGGAEVVLPMCDLAETQRAAILAQVDEAAGRAFRVLAFAHKDLSGDAADHDAIEHDMTFDGLAFIADPLRDDVVEAVARCADAGISLKMLTGDNVHTARSIAGELGLLKGGARCVEARDVESWDDETLARELGTVAVVARSTPSVKMRVVRALRAAGEVVAVTGDGVNDAPALKNADVGVAMGVSGTEVSKEASDIVLLDDSFSTIVSAVRWGRGVYENFKRFISFQLTVNVASVVVVLVSILMGFDAPFTALQLLWINIIMDGPPALTLGLEPVHDDLMDADPVRRDENILSPWLLGRIGVTALYMSVVFLVQYATNFLGCAPDQMPTVLFCLFTLFRLFNSFNCRELHDGSMFRHLLSNRLMLGVVGLTFVLQVLIIQYAGAFFGTVPLPLDLWLKLFAASASVVVLAELVKAVMRAWHARARR